MPPFRSYTLCAPQQQVLSSSMHINVPKRCRMTRRFTASAALSESANGNGKVYNKQLKFYYFDPTNPEDVREFVAKQHDSKSHHSASTHGNSNSHLSNNGHHNNGHHHSHNGAPANGHTQLLHAKESGKDVAQIQRLSKQLEEARSTLAKLQQFEVLYKESRMRSKQMQVEVSTLQQLLADKDAELARQYKRMEVEATERSGLRTQFNSAIDEVKALRNELEEARQAMLELRGIIPANVTLRRGGRPPTYLDDSSSNTANGADALSSLQGLAKQLADGMEREVGTLFGGVGKREI